MTEPEIIRVLLVEDDEDDCFLVKELLKDIKSRTHLMHWANTYETGLTDMVRNKHDVCLVDYRLGAHNGVELLQAAVAKGCSAPIIILTGMGQPAVDLAAMKAGAADYLVKGKIDANQLERSIRYAVERKRASARAGFEHARLAAFGSQVGLALARRAELPVILEGCAQAMVQYLSAALGQIWIYDAEQLVLEPRAHAGPVFDAAGSHLNIPVPAWAGGSGGGNGEPASGGDGESAVSPSHRHSVSLLAGGKPILIKSCLGDKQFSNQAWLREQNLVSFAGQPLLLEDRLVGMISLYSRAPLTETVLQELGSVANGIALCIQRKQAEVALAASENRYRSVVEGIKEVIFQMNEFGHWSYLNPAWTAITGFPVAETLGKFFLEYLHADDREQGRTLFLKLVNREIEHCGFETRLLTKVPGAKSEVSAAKVPGAKRDVSGAPPDPSLLTPRTSPSHVAPDTYRWVELYLQLTRDCAGTVLGASGSLNDITERKKAEAQVQKLAAFPRVNPNPVLEFAADGTLSYANDAAFRLAKSLGKEQITDTLPAGVRAMVSGCLSGDSKRLSEEVCFDGRTITWSFFPVATSRVVHCYGTEITEMLSLEAQFRHAQKLESVGQMAAGIAHDFNNMLTVIQGYADCLLTRPGADSATSSSLKQIAGAARRAATLTRQLLMFSRKQVIQARPLDLSSVSRDLVGLLPRLLGEDIALETDFARDLPAIEADPGMIEQVVMNLAVNARDAMPRGGCLTITTKAVQITEEHARQLPEARPGLFICLSVKDTGSGMDAKTLARIFEPFFSTKDVGRGTGLGLATVYGILKQHQGWIEVATQIGAGTTFKLFFPALKSAAVESEDQSDAPAAVRGGRETILLVEDEPVLRELVGTVLRGYEYNVLEAGTGVEALKVWEENAGRVDLLLTDMVMPGGMSGSDLAKQLRQRRPDLRIIYSSGHSPEVMGRNFGESDMEFLQKPYRPPLLAQRVRKCLDAPPKPDSELLPA